ncbi:MAG: putative amidohydrolase [Candidatus Azotimanducaceae bacterium]|jgi:predicted amidohydrolase
MTRSFYAAAAQLGPINKAETRSSVIERMLVLMEQAYECGCKLIVFPEMALTTFFPRWHITDATELGNYFENQMPGPDTQVLFDTAREYQLGFYLGYCERTSYQSETSHFGFNTSILVDQSGTIIGKYRKVHLAGNAIPDSSLLLQHLEPWYFVDGDLGFPVFNAMLGKLGMLLCNDRRWPESWRMLGLQGAELVCLGYNSPSQLPDSDAICRIHRGLVLGRYNSFGRFDHYPYKFE